MKTLASYCSLLYLHIIKWKLMITSKQELQFLLDALRSNIEFTLKKHINQCDVKVKKIVTNLYVIDIENVGVIDIESLEAVILIVEKYKYFRTYEYKSKDVFRVVFDFN